MRQNLMKRSGNENVNLDKLHYHEALDRTYIEQCNLENSLGGHPVIQNHPELKALYNESVENLGDLYQKAGSRYFCESLFWASQPKQAAKT
ncbi:hypothetical protein [Bathymodiolus platifrons methanotrophic gill symbiont]|uniref:hypothetical protein n=1 Tax=Bathymodiolus platifrons methanotrophic gill symbiont TaxID=113268 RepID=UPI001C8D6750|nr:hypothetical protein [Bathymodiolus platifrons methanotrophic gill symbiont]